MDQITLEAARRGDRTAQARLLAELQDIWFRVCLGLLGNAEDARDAAQETALRFLRELPKFRAESSVKTWSIGISMNVARELRRKRRHFDSPQAMADISSNLDGPETTAADTEAGVALHATLATLPDRQREALLLRYFEGLSVEETAAAMQCAGGTVKATVHQALRALRDKLAPRKES